MSTSPRSSRRLGDRPVVAFTLAATALVAAAGISFGAMSAAGIPLTGGGNATKPVHAVNTLNLTDTPAEHVITAALDTAPAGWTPAASTTRPAPLPHPWSCNPAGTTPALSISRHYDTNGTGIDITVTAYSAGIGAAAYRTLHDSVPNCASGHATMNPTGGIGVESTTTTINGVTVIATRRGDTITYVTSTDNPTAVAAASQFDSNLASKLAGTCSNESSGVADATRNRWAAASYTPYTVPGTVTVPATELPAVPAGATYQPVTIPAPVTPVADVEPMPTPTYPVWPLMPKALVAPTAPVAPAAAAPTTSPVRLLAADTTGPGCGWAFTGMKAPGFDSKAAAETNRKTETAAKTVLTTKAKQWQAAVLAYWKSYATYTQQLPAYVAYTQQVTAVNSAWLVIAGEWDQYQKSHDAWQIQMNNRDQFITDQKAAQTKYDAAIAECMNPTPAPTPTPDPSATPSPSPTAAPPANPKTRAECVTEVPRPAILNQLIPTVPMEPMKPADPRPAGSQ